MSDQKQRKRFDRRVANLPAHELFRLHGVKVDRRKAERRAA